MEKVKAGLLPFYLKLYDDQLPEKRAGFKKVLKDVTVGLEKCGLEIVTAPVCRIKSEFAKAVELFKKEKVDCIITLHLAYSPSLESVDVIAKSGLPVIILDTTTDASFDQRTSPDKIMYNHGVHGVMDFASMLRRVGRRFEIIAGHYLVSNVLERTANAVRAITAAKSFRSTSALRIGESFKGMGDFAVDEKTMASKLGIRVTQKGIGDLAKAASSISIKQVEDEVKNDRKLFKVVAPLEVHVRSVRVGLGLRKLIQDGGFKAFSMNFLAFDGSYGVDTLPFLEASKGMAAGTGYGGEGDVLTASLVGALQRAFGQTTFTEIFCADWKGGNIFLSHMGEINPDVAEGKPLLVEKPFLFKGTKNPAILTCAIKRGDAVFVNLAPGPHDTFRLIAAPVTVLADTKRKDMASVVRGWVKPKMRSVESPAKGVEKFLEEYSRNGGTHHSALMLGDKLEALEIFARHAGFEWCVIE